MPTETINLNQKKGSERIAPPQDVNAPVEPLDIRLNFNCMLYLFTELVSLCNELVVVLKEKEQLTDEEIRRIYEITANKETLVQTYQPVFNRFMEYYVTTKKDVTGEEPMKVGPNFGARDENSAPV